MHILPETPQFTAAQQRFPHLSHLAGAPPKGPSCVMVMYDTCNGEASLLSNVFHAPAGFCAQGSRPVCISYLQGTRFRPSIRRPGRSVPASSFAATPTFGQPFSTTRLPETEARIYGDGLEVLELFMVSSGSHRPREETSPAIICSTPKLSSVCSLTYHNDQRAKQR
ncbi:hypothetical protein GJ744_012080 [Endocarpon pusillum]|uniref:Uncharacterized protein n=1 Tax=Endocarpon pusillum TaxID=364733 RepID=A0A8H7AFU0_9EURO|nr:hypothetical protein GJ744_012080 [Endocarpon pusillum]